LSKVFGPKRLADPVSETFASLPARRTDN